MLCGHGCTAYDEPDELEEADAEEADDADEVEDALSLELCWHKRKGIVDALNRRRMRQKKLCWFEAKEDVQCKISQHHKAIHDEIDLQRRNKKEFRRYL